MSILYLLKTVEPYYNSAPMNVKCFSDLCFFLVLITLGVCVCVGPVHYSLCDALHKLAL